MISLVRGSQNWEYVSDFFLTFNYKLRNKLIKSFAKQNLINDSEDEGNSTLEIRFIMFIHAKCNRNEYCPCFKLLPTIFGASNQWAEFMNFRWTRSNCVWNNSVLSCRIPEITTNLLKIRSENLDLSGRNIFQTIKPRAFAKKTRIKIMWVCNDRQKK